MTVDDVACDDPELVVGDVRVVRDCRPADGALLYFSSVVTIAAVRVLDLRSLNYSELPAAT